MRVVSAIPDDRYSNSDRVSYACECGEIKEFFVARKGEAERLVAHASVGDLISQRGRQ
jgi:hypothetical protein